VKLIELKFDSLLHHPVGSQILLLHFAAGSQIFPLHDTAGVQPMIFAEIFLLHFAVGRCDSLLHLAVRSQVLPAQMQRRLKSYCYIMQRGVKSYRCKMQRGMKGKISGNISPKHDTAVRFHSPLHDTVGVKSYHCIMQRGVKSPCHIMQRGASLAAQNQD
jgi:hypothetical protein